MSAFQKRLVKRSCVTDIDSFYCNTNTTHILHCTRASVWQASRQTTVMSKCNYIFFERRRVSILRFFLFLFFFLSFIWVAEFYRAQMCFGAKLIIAESSFKYFFFSVCDEYFVSTFFFMCRRPATNDIFFFLRFLPLSSKFNSVHAMLICSLHLLFICCSAISAHMPKERPKAE